MSIFRHPLDVCRTPRHTLVMGKTIKGNDTMLTHAVKVACETMTAANRARAAGDVATADALAANVAAMWTSYNAGTLRF